MQIIDLNEFDEEENNGQKNEKMSVDGKPLSGIEQASRARRNVTETTADEATASETTADEATARETSASQAMSKKAAKLRESLEVSDATSGIRSAVSSTSDNATYSENLGSTNSNAAYNDDASNANDNASNANDNIYSDVTSIGTNMSNTDVDDDLVGGLEISDVNHKDLQVRKRPAKPEKEKPSALREFISWALYLGAAIILALVIKNYVIINANIPSGSMENTIQIGDDIIGFRLAYKFSEPQRGDIVIFNARDKASEVNPNVDSGEKFIKRIVGLPGETVRITDSKVYINDELLNEPYIKSWVALNTGDYEFEVPEGCYLVLGDNRDNSSDARQWYNEGKDPYVKESDILAKAVFRYYPFDSFGTIE